MDYASLLYAPVYSVLGVPATLTLPGTDGAVLTITALDKTAGIEVGGSVEVQTIMPAAVVRASELADIDLADLRGSEFEMNGKAWEIHSHLLKPSPKGEADGEVYLLLTEQA